MSRTSGYRHVQPLKRLDAIIAFLLSLCCRDRTVLCHRPHSSSRPSRDVENERGKVRSILLIRPGGIGDAVLLIPFVRALRTQLPSASLTVLAERRNAAVFHPLLGEDIHELLCYDRLSDLARLVRRSFDLVIDTEQWHVLSAFVARWVGRRGARIGFATNVRATLFTHPVPYDDDGFEGAVFFCLLDPLGAQVSAPSPFRSFLPLTPRGGEIVERPLVALFPGASIPERRWPPERFREVARWLRSRGCNVIVVGGKEDTKAAQVIADGVEGVESVAGKTSLEETARLLALADLLVSSDSGVMHLAVAVGTPVVALFGAGIESKWAPRDGVSRVLNKRLPCSPCTRYGYTPPCPHRARCVQEISVGEVREAVISLLDGAERSGEPWRETDAVGEKERGVSGGGVSCG